MAAVVHQCLPPGEMLLGWPTLLSAATLTHPRPPQPIDNGSHSRCFISDSYGSSSHLEETALNILSLYYSITGKHYDFEKV